MASRPVPEEGLVVTAITATDDSVVVAWAAADPRIPWPGDPDDGPADPKSERLTLTDDLGTTYRRSAGSAYFRPRAHGTVTFEPAPPPEATTLVARGEHQTSTLDRRTGKLVRMVTTD